MLPFLSRQGIQTSRQSVLLTQRTQFPAHLMAQQKPFRQVGNQKRQLWNAIKSVFSFGPRLVTGAERNIATDITLGDEIGVGRYGKVYSGVPTAEFSSRMARDGENQSKVSDVEKVNGDDMLQTPMYAVKRIPKSSLSRDYKIQVHDLINEINVLKCVQKHKNIMRFVDVYEDRYYLHIVTELCKGPELFDRIVQHGHFTERQAAGYLEQILQAIAHCHRNKVAHRDIKPENLLFRTEESNSDLVLIDFGMSRIQEENGILMHQACGSPSYCSPEVLLGNYTEKCDTWSIGVLLYIMLSGISPFGGDTDTEIMANILRGNVSFADPVWNLVSPDAIELTSQLLMNDPNLRLSAEQALSHRWVSDRENAPDTPLVNALRNIQKFTSHNHFKRISLRIISQLAHNSKEMNEIRWAFDVMDEDDDGLIDGNDVSRALQTTLLGQGLTLTELEDLVIGADTDGNGRVDVDEFMAAAMTQALYTKTEYLTQAFAQLDTSNSGTITRDELKAVLGSTSTTSSDREVDEILRLVDTNKDGEISFEEFTQAMTNSNSRGGEDSDQNK